jgi:hypothetical protein
LAIFVAPKEYRDYKVPEFKAYKVLGAIIIG